MEILSTPAAPLPLRTKPSRRPDRDLLRLPEFKLTHGGVIRNLRIAYSDVGPADGPVALVMGGISADRDVTGASGWWGELAGPSRVLDTRRDRVIAFDWIGGHGLSTRSEGASSPVIDTKDQARAALAILDHLGLSRFDSVIGSSYGGLVAQHLALAFPRRVGRVLILGAGHRPFPLATALRCIQRRILREGARQGVLEQATALARGLAVTTYRSGREFADRFFGAPRIGADGIRCEVEDYLEHQGERFAERFGLWSYLRLSESIDLHAIAPEEIQVPIDIVAFEGDQIAPPEQLREFKRRKGKDCRLWVVPTRFGHDGFLKEIDALRPLIARCAPERETVSC